MARNTSYDIFLSYSRRDETFVKGILDLMQLNGRRIFCDVAVIRPGDVWAEELENALIRSKMVVLLWCCDSAESEWVKREIELAVQLKKRLIPVLLCSYPAPLEMTARQYIDMQAALRHACNGHAIYKNTPAVPSLDSARTAKMQREYRIGVLLLRLLLGFYLLYALFLCFVVPVTIPFLLVGGVAFVGVLAALRKRQFMANTEALLLEALNRVKPH
jgi:hypothetical protein